MWRVYTHSLFVPQAISSFQWYIITINNILCFDGNGAFWVLDSCIAITELNSAKQELMVLKSLVMNWLPKSISHVTRGRADEISPINQYPYWLQQPFKRPLSKFKLWLDWNQSLEVSFDLSVCFNCKLLFQESVIVATSSTKSTVNPNLYKEVLIIKMTFWSTESDLCFVFLCVSLLLQIGQ